MIKMINSSRSGLVLFSGNGNPALSEEISKQLGVKLGQANVTTFSDGEISISIEDIVLIIPKIKIRSVHRRMMMIFSRAF